MKVAVSVGSPGAEAPVDPRFGRAGYFAVFDDASGAWETVGNAQNLHAAQGAGIQSAATVVNSGCDTLVCGHCGPKAFAALQRAGVTVYQATSGTAREAVEALKHGTLPRLGVADVDSHW
jgi:predicted Fe-Mo cluster-binding NifX family protein